MAKINTDVMIEDKMYTISSEQDAAYVRGLAAYVNEKMEDIRRRPDYSKQPYGIKQAILLMNFADDYFQMKQQAEEAKRLYEEQETAFYNMKREMVSMQLELEKIRAERECTRTAGETAGVSVCPYLQSLEKENQ